MAEDDVEGIGCMLLGIEVRAYYNFAEQVRTMLKYFHGAQNMRTVCAFSKEAWSPALPLSLLVPESTCQHLAQCYPRLWRVIRSKRYHDNGRRHGQ